MNEHPVLERLTGERRLGASIQLIGSLVALMLNFGGMIWFAATITAHQDEVQRTVAPLVTQANATAIAVAILQVRADNATVRLDHLEQKGKEP